MEKILLDTNILLVPHTFKVDIFTELSRIYNSNLELFVLKQTITELEKLTKIGKYKNKLAAKIGLDLIKAKDLKILSQKEGYTDDILVYFAQKGYIVATQDAKLKKRLKKENLEHVTLRQTKYLIKINSKN